MQIQYAYQTKASNQQYLMPDEDKIFGGCLVLDFRK